LRADDYSAAVKQIEEGVEGIREFYREHARLELLEQSGEIHSLENWLVEIHAKRPLTEREKIEKALHEAVQHEDYEKAAQMRDALRNFKIAE
jgi:protein-arginine kinase activator protein McsA